MASLSHLSTMLVVEDEAIIALDIEATLYDAGVGLVVVAGRTEDAHALLSRHAIEAAVLDLHLGPDQWTYDIARELEARGVPFIFSSGTVEVAEGFEHLPLVVKPFSTDQLMAALLQVVGTPSTVAAQ